MKRMFGAEKKQEQQQQQQQQEEKAQRGFFQKLVSGLEKTKQGFVDKVEQIMTGRKVDE